jgi:23S rRNA pseudouridine2605 synthase
MNGKSDQHKSGERIAKVIARAGLASRREAEAWIKAGRVAVNGETIRSPARDVAVRDRITVDGAPLPARERTRLFLYHKPRGLLTTHADPQGRPTIFQNLPQGLPRLVSVGRLDFNTEGLLLLTNDGALARALELPATGWLRRYRVRAHGSVEQDKLDALRKGVTISGIHYGSIDAAIERVQASNLWLTFAIREGKNREVRNVLSHLGLTVTRLIRVSFGPFQLGELEVAAVEEVPTRILREQLGDKLITLVEADFSAPIAPIAVAPIPVASPPDGEHRPARPRPGKPREAAKSQPEKEKRKPRQSTHHAWRAHEEDRTTKKLHRKFRARRKDETRVPPAGEMRAELVSDRKGRHVPVERYGQPPVRERPVKVPAKPIRRGRRRAPDRAFGARPRQPRGR